MNDSSETAQERARRHVAEQQVLIATQRTLIAKIYELGLPPATAEEVLATMEKCLVILRRNLDKLERSAG